MAKKTITFDTVREIGLALPDVEEGTTYGAPSLKVHGKTFACPAIHRSADPGSLAIRIAFDRREALMAADPDVYYITDHYLNYPALLVRLSRVHRHALRDLLLMARQFVSASGKRRVREPRGSRASSKRAHVSQDQIDPRAWREAADYLNKAIVLREELNERGRAR